MIQSQKPLKVFLVSLFVTAVVLAIVFTGFFMFTAKLSSPTKMDLYMPKDSEEDTVDQYAHVRTKLTIILLKDDKVFGYYGDIITDGRSVPLVGTDKLIADGWNMFSKDSLVVVIKPAKEATYKATVDILDQMAANNIERYSMTDLNKKEKEFLKIAE